MTKEQFLLNPEQRPSWLEYPQSFCRLVEQGIIHITPWHLMEAQRALVLSKDFARGYKRELFPFAYRQDTDDVACWSKGTGEKVFIIHNFASPGWEDEETFEDFWSWFRDAIEETIDWD